VSTLCERIAGEPVPDTAAQVASCIERELPSDYPYPGNVRELEQCVRRVLLTGHCVRPGAQADKGQLPLSSRIERGELAAEELVRAYCEHLYAREKSYVQVAKITGLDRRTVRRHLTSSE
jgi:transcriptional regulator with GAF, ATPase, and Fis domain